MVQQQVLKTPIEFHPDSAKKESASVALILIIPRGKNGRFHIQ